MVVKVMGWYEIYGVINEEMKCFEIGIDKHKEIKDLDGNEYKIPKDLRTKEIWTIGGLQHEMNLLMIQLAKDKIKFCYFPELRLK